MIVLISEILFLLLSLYLHKVIIYKIYPDLSEQEYKENRIVFVIGYLLAGFIQYLSHINT